MPMNIFDKGSSNSGHNANLKHIKFTVLKHSDYKVVYYKLLSYGQRHTQTILRWEVVPLQTFQFTNYINSVHEYTDNFQSIYPAFPNSQSQFFQLNSAFTNEFWICGRI